MADVKIQMRANGPFIVEGTFELSDSQGNPYPLDPSKPAVALCRCGHSKNRPFCDGSHRDCGFVSDESAGDA